MTTLTTGLVDEPWPARTERVGGPSAFETRYRKTSGRAMAIAVWGSSSMWVAPVVRGRLSATRILPFSVMETAFSHNGGLAAYRQMRSLAAASWAGTMVFASTEKAFGSQRQLSSKRSRAGVDAPSSWTAMKPALSCVTKSFENFAKTSGLAPSKAASGQCGATTHGLS